MNRIKSILNVASLTFLSRVLGLIRELVFAKYFGTTQIADVINLSFRLPNLFRKIFAEGAMSSIFIPEFNSKLLISLDAAQKFSEKILVIISISSITVIILMEIFMQNLLYVIAPGFITDEQKFDLTLTMCRITIPYIFFIAIVSLIGSILNSLGNFRPFAVTSIIMNICLILGMIFLDNYFSYYSFSVSLIIAGILQLTLIQNSLKNSKFELNFLKSLRYIKNFKLKEIFYNRKGDFYRIFKNSNYVLVISGLQQLNIFISQSFASFIESAISMINYADRVNQICISIVGVTLSTILLPELSYLYKKKDLTRINILQNSFIRWGFFLSIPMSIFIFFFSEQIIKLIFQRGYFTTQDTQNTALILSTMIIGSVPIILTKILNNIFYAMQKLKNLITISFFMIFINLLLTFPLLKIWGILGIIIANTFISWMNFIILVHISTKKSYLLISNQTIVFAIKIFGINLIFLAINFFSKNFLDKKASNCTIICFIFIIIGEFLIYVALSYLFGIFSALKFSNKR